MALSFVQYTADGVTDTFNIPFDYLSQSHIQVKVDGTPDNSITFPTSATVKTSSVPANGAVVEVRRKTPTDSRIVDFQDGSILSEGDLDTSALQNFYVMQETYDDLVNKLGLGSTGKWEADGKIIQNLLDGVGVNDAVTVGQVLGLVTSGQNINFPLLAGDALKFLQVRSDETGYQHTALGALASKNTVANGDIDTDAVDGTKIADDAINSEHYADGSIDTVHLANDAVTTNKILDGAVTVAKLDSAISLVKTGIRQAILTGPVDADGRANHIGTGTGLQPEILGSSVPIHLTFADGFGDDGAVDYVTKVNYDASFDALPANNRSLLYGELNIGTGLVSLGNTLLPPQYGKAFDKREHSLLHFDGTDGSTTIVDEFGNTWTAGGDAQLDTTGPTTDGPKFGSACLKLDGSGDYITTLDLNFVRYDRWTLEGWFNFNIFVASQTLFSSDVAHSFILYHDGTRLLFYADDNESGWTIASGVTGILTSWNTDQWYHIVLEFTGSEYRVYVDGVLDITVSSTLRMAGDNGIRIGMDYSSGGSLSGFVDEVRFTGGSSRYGDAFTPPAAAFSPDVYWFDLNNFKMNYGGPGSWQVKQILFLGEADTDASTVTSVISYPIRHHYVSDPQLLTASTTFNFNHNLGFSPENLRVSGVLEDKFSGWVQKFVAEVAGDYSYPALHHDFYTSRNAYTLRTGSNITNYTAPDGTTHAFSTADRAELTVMVERNW